MIACLHLRTELLLLHNTSWRIEPKIEGRHNGQIFQMADIDASFPCTPYRTWIKTKKTTLLRWSPLWLVNRTTLSLCIKFELSEKMTRHAYIAQIDSSCQVTHHAAKSILHKNFKVPVFDAWRIQWGLQKPATKCWTPHESNSKQTSFEMFNCFLSTSNCRI